MKPIDYIAISGAGLLILYAIHTLSPFQTNTTGKIVIINPNKAVQNKQNKQRISSAKVIAGYMEKKPTEHPTADVTKPVFSKKDIQYMPLTITGATLTRELVPQAEKAVAKYLPDLAENSIVKMGIKSIPVVGLATGTIADVNTREDLNPNNPIDWGVAGLANVVGDIVGSAGAMLPPPVDIGGLIGGQILGENVVYSLTDVLKGGNK